MEQRRNRRRFSVLTAVLGLGYILGVAIFDEGSVHHLDVFGPMLLNLEWTFESRRSFSTPLTIAGTFAFGMETGPVDEPSARQQENISAVRLR